MPFAFSTFAFKKGETMKAIEVHSRLAKYMLADGMPPVFDIEKSHGSWLVDARDGREYLDMFSFFASGSIGHNHPKIVARKDELGLVAINKPTNSDIYTEAMTEFVETFGRVAMTDYLPHSFYISGGGLAVENAMKAAMDWKVRKNMERGITGEVGMQIIHFKQAFHGRTGYTLSLTNTSDPRKTMYFPKFDWPRITNPKIKFPLEENLESVIAMENQAIEEIKTAVAERKNDIAALIIEPIQGEGGDNHFRTEFHKKLRELADEHEFMLIYDEVQSGIGITGKMWAHQNYGIEPDLVSFGKKTQVCGFLSGRRIEEVEKHVFAESSRLNSTFGGNLIDMVRFKYTLDVIEEENLVEHAAKMGDYLLQKMVDLQAKHSKMTGARGLGLFAAFDLPNGEIRDELVGKLMDNGVIMLGCGDESMRFRPHLNVTQDEIDHVITILDKVLG